MAVNLSAFSTRVGNRGGIASPCRNVRSEHVLHAVPDESERFQNAANVLAKRLIHAEKRDHVLDRNFAAVYHFAFISDGTI